MYKKMYFIEIYKELITVAVTFFAQWVDVHIIIVTLFLYALATILTSLN